MYYEPNTQIAKELKITPNLDKFCYGHHHVSIVELGHLLTRSGLTYLEVSSKVYHDSFCQSGSSVSLLWVIYCDAFYLHVVSIVSCIPVICPKLVLFLTPLQFVYFGIWLVICPSVLQTKYTNWKGVKNNTNFGQILLRSCT